MMKSNRALIAEKSAEVKDDNLLPRRREEEKKSPYQVFQENTEPFLSLEENQIDMLYQPQQNSALSA